MTTPAQRSYDLAYDRAWRPAVLPGTEPPPPDSGPGLPVIEWAGLNLNTDEDTGGDGERFTAVVTNVEGWYGSPGLDGQNADRALGDGSLWGPKRRTAREITIEGAAVGPRAQIMGLRDQLALRAAALTPGELVISDPWLRTGLSALVRADDDRLEHEFFGGRRAFRWQVTLIAADPLLYDRDWQQLTLTTRTDADAGRPYTRLYRHPRDHGDANGWAYGQPYPPSSAGRLANRGSADAPVYARYDGDLHASRLTDETRSLLLDPLETGQQILVACATMTAEAPGGAHRAQWVRPGSRPMSIPAFSTARWHLYSQGSGSVTLSWRSAWW